MDFQVLQFKFSTGLLGLSISLLPLWAGAIAASASPLPPLADPVPLKVVPAAPRTPPLAAAAQPSPSVWSDVEVNDGGFRILMPGEVDRKVNLVQVNGLPIQQTLLLATQPQHDALYMVAWSDLSADAPLDEAGRRQVLEQTKQSFLKSFRGQLTEEINMELLGNAGKQYVMSSSVRGNPFTITSRAYLVGRRLFHILAAVPKRVEPSLQGSTKGFLQSFRLQPILANPGTRVGAQTGASMGAVQP